MGVTLVYKIVYILGVKFQIASKYLFPQHTHDQSANISLPVLWNPSGKVSSVVRGIRVVGVFFVLFFLTLFPGSAFYIPRISEIVWHLLFSFLLSIPVVTKGKIFSFLTPESQSIVDIFFRHSSVIGYLGCFQNLVLLHLFNMPY